MLQLNMELNVYVGSASGQVPQNKRPKFTFVVYHALRKLYYIELTPAVFSKYISGNVVLVMDAFIFYCSRANRSLTPFNSSITAVSWSDDDALSSN